MNSDDQRDHKYGLLESTVEKRTSKKELNGLSDTFEDDQVSSYLNDSDITKHFSDFNSSGNECTSESTSYSGGQLNVILTTEDEFVGEGTSSSYSPVLAEGKSYMTPKV